MNKYFLLTILIAVVTPVMAQDDNDKFNADLGIGVVAKKPVVSASARKQAQLYPDAYYTTSSGKRLQYRLHKDNYLLTPKKADTKAPKPDMAKLKASLEAEFGTELELAKDTTFKGKIRVKVKEGKNQKNIFKRLRKKTDVDYISPVLLSDKGGELALSPGVIIRIQDSGPIPDSLLSDLATLGLTLQKQLDFTNHEFLFQYSGLIEDPSGLFQATRAAMALPQTEWAEPNFEVAPVKRFTPNDSLYPNQWHLNNTGQNGGQPGADVNAPDGWNLSRATGTVVAIVDDGVDLSHPDLPIWNNPGESGGGKETDGIDNDSNGFIDDYQGWDFGDGDNNPGPESTDDHGTSVAGVAAAQGDNTIGVSGSASNATILPLRTGSMLCTDWGNTIRYAAKYGDVVNGSWGISACETEIDSAIADGVGGTIPDARRGDKGTPILFATGNSASGWINFSLSGIPAGTYVFEWEYNKDFSVSDGYDTMWLDDIIFPGGSTTDFEGPLTLPPGFATSGDTDWAVVSDGVHARGASGNSARAGTISNNQVTTLTATKTVSAGTLTFWAWISSEQNYDIFDLYVTAGSTRYGPFFSYSPGQNGHQNEVGYPSSNPNAISIGASNDGGPGGSEERSYYSQFGPGLDVLAPSSGGNQDITTTDRVGADGYTTSDYTDDFGGTSSATPLAAGVVADIIGIYPHITAAQVRDALRHGADEIGPYAYVADRNDHYGHGRINLLGSLDWIKANNLAFDCDLKDELIADRWALIGLPCAADSPGTVASTLGDNLDISLYLGDWIMGEKRLVGANNYTTLGTGSVIEPGRGYWVKSTLGDAAGGAFLDGGALDVQGTETPAPITTPECPSSNGCFVIALNPPAISTTYEWNLVAHPLAFPVDWADVRIVVDDLDVYVPSEAEVADVVSATYQVWNGSTYTPKDDTTPAMEGTLQPGEGFWVKTLPGAIGKSVKLLIPAVPSLKTSHITDEQTLPWYAAALNWLIPSVHAQTHEDYDRWYTIGYAQRKENKSARKKRLKDGTDWYIQLSVQSLTDKLEDPVNAFGHLADSVAGYDRHDLKELPPFSTPYLTLVFPHGDWGDEAGNYASDYRSPRNRDNWLFEVHTDEVGRDVDLCWEGPEEIIDRSVLVEIGSKKNKHRLKRNRYKNGCLSVYMNEPVKQFRWKYK